VTLSVRCDEFQTGSLVALAAVRQDVADTVFHSDADFFLYGEVESDPDVVQDRFTMYGDLRINALQILFKRSEVCDTGACNQEVVYVHDYGDLHAIIGVCDESVFLKLCSDAFIQGLVELHDYRSVCLYHATHPCLTSAATQT